MRSQTFPTSSWLELAVDFYFLEKEVADGEK